MFWTFFWILKGLAGGLLNSLSPVFVLETCPKPLGTLGVKGLQAALRITHLL